MAFLRRPLTQDDAFDPNFGAGFESAYDIPAGANTTPGVPAYQNGGMENMPTTKPTPPPIASPTYNTQGWDTDSFGNPQYIASSFGNAPSGWDPAKWADPMHQTPKYVWGRIYQEAQQSGDPNWQQNAINNFMKAYPGTQIQGDIAHTPWGENVDIFTDYGLGNPLSKNGISWNVEGAGGPGGGGGDLQSILAMLGNRANLAGSIGGAPSGGGGGAAPGGFDPSSAALIEQLGPLHPQWAQYQAWKAAQGQGGSASGGSATGPQAPQGGMQSLYDVIGRMLDKSGDYNKDILQRRVESAREQMNSARSSQSDLLRGQLSQRGLLGQGPETTAMTGLEEQLSNIYGGQVRDIYADESARSDQRLLQTMGIAAGLSGDDAQRLVDWFNAQTGRDVGMGQIAATNRKTDAEAAADAGRLGLGYSQLDLDRLLGQGNLALGNLGEMNRYNLGLGDLGLRRDVAGYDVQHNQLGDMLEIIKLMNPNLYQQIPPQYR